MTASARWILFCKCVSRRCKLAVAGVSSLSFEVRTHVFDAGGAANFVHAAIFARIFIAGAVEGVRNVETSEARRFFLLVA